MEFTKHQKDEIKKFIQDINFEYKVFFEEIFEADIYDEEIFVGSKEYANSQDGQMFMNWFSKYFNCHINAWLIALLHEIGHLETTTEELQENRDIAYSVLKMLYLKRTLSREELNNEYFIIPCELEATSWGVNYYINNKTKCENLLKTLDLI